MSYIGQRPVVGRYIKLDQISSGFNGSNTGFSMTAGSQAVFPGTARNLLLSLGGVIQEPDTDFTISGSTLTFTTPPVANTTFFGVIYGDMQATGTPSDGTVLPASIATSGNFSFPEITITGDLNIADKIIHSGDTDTALRFPANNAISAETSGNEVLRLDSSGRILIGKTSNRQTRLGTNSFSPDIQFEDESIGAVSMTRLSDNNAPPRFILQKTRGSIASAAAVINNDLTGQILFSGFDGSNFCNTAQIRSEVDGTPGTNDMPGNLLFMTTSDGSTTTLERMRITSSGEVGIGTSSPGDLIHVVDGADDCAIRIEATAADKDARLKLFAHSNGVSQVRFGDQDDGDIGGLTYDHTNDSLEFRVSNNERMQIDSSGRLLIGTTSARSPQGITAALQVEGTDAGTSSFSLIRNSANQHSPNLIFSKSRGASDGSSTVVQNNDALGMIAWVGSDGSDSVSAAARITGAVDGTPGSNDMPGRLEFLTTADGATAPTERMRIDSSGNVGIGTDSPNVNFHVSATSSVAKIESTASATSARLIIKSANDTYTGLHFGDDGDDDVGRIRYYHTDNHMHFSTGASERMRIDADGDVGIGTSSPGGNRLMVQLTDDNSDGLVVKGGSGQGRTNIRVQMGNSDSSSSTGYRITNSSGTTIASLFIMNDKDDLNFMNQSSGGQIIFNTSSTSNSLGSLARARFDMDGNFFGGKSSSDVNNTGFELKQNGLNAFTRNNGGVLAVNRGTNNGTLISLRRSNNEGGTIGVTPTSASFNTSSDYRLKENVLAISDGITRLKTLKPYRFNFKVDASTTVDGFLAHEVTAVPEAITGTKDQVVTQAMIDSGEYEEGTLNDPIYQSIDQSKLVPLLVAALQEEISKREALEARVAALEAA